MITQEKNGTKSLQNTNSETLTLAYQEDIKFIAEKAEKLNLNNSIIILKPMNKKRRKRIHEIISEMDNVSSYSIGAKNDRRIFLKYSQSKPADKDLSALLKEGNRLYCNQQYTKCIKVFEEALSYLYHPKSFIFAMLGISYIKIKKTDKAIDYLVIATELAKLENNIKNDFTDLIMDLQDKSSNNQDDEKKPRFTMDATEFAPEELNNFCIKDLKEILISILIQKEDIDLVFEVNELNEEQCNIIRLVIARYFYSIKAFDAGDKIYKVVEKSKDKAKVVKKLLDEIRLNKQFYQYRENQDPVALVLARKKEQI